MSAPKTFEEAGFSRTPRWLRGIWGDRFLTVCYGIFDTVNAAAVQAARAGAVETCPDDAVEAHAESRMIEPLPGETTEALRLRAIDAWAHWTGANNTWLEEKIVEYMPGTDRVSVYDIANDDWTGGAALDGYDDDNGDNASRLMLVFDATYHPWDRDVVGPGLIVGPELLVGITMTGTELSRLRRIFKRYRPGHMIGIGADVIMDGTTAAAHLADHAATADLVRLPLHAPLVGYQQHSMTTGPHLVVGQGFT